MLKKKKIRIIICGVILTYLFIMTFVPTNRPLKAPKGQTRVTISQMFLCTLVAEQAQNKPILQILDKKYSEYGSDYESKLAKFLKESGLKLRFSQTTNGRIQVLDLWGNPFIVLPRNEALKLNLPHDLLSNKSLIIWSCGPDGKNQLGLGDDIFWTDPNFN